MAIEVVIPKLGMTMEEGTLAEWLVPDGGEVKAGEPVYRIETEKIEMDIEADGPGIVRQVQLAGSTLPCGVVVGYILAAGEAMPQGAAPVAAVASAPVAAAAAPVAAAAPAAAGERVAATPAARRLASEKSVDLAQVTGTGPGGRITEADIETAAAAPRPAAPMPVPAAAGGEVLASPLARRIAESLGVNIAAVRGTGPGGRITKEDVEAAASTRPAPAPGRPAPAATGAVGPRPGESIPLRGMRKVISERMYGSLQAMAQLTLGMEVMVDELVKLRAGLIEEWKDAGIRPSYTDFVIAAVARALRKHPIVNAQMGDGTIQLLDDVHVGMAVAVDAGLVVPVIRHADRLALKELAAESSRLAEAARTNKLGPDDFVGGTFSVSTLGMFSVDFFTPIINPPNAAILGVGRLKDAITWEGDRPVRSQQMTLSLTWDHRVFDGVPAAQFTQTVRDLLQQPFRLLV